MLYSVDSQKYVSSLPHKKQYDILVKRLSQQQYQKIIDELNKRIINSDVNTSSWIPGSDWTGTVWEPIYTACYQNVEEAGKFFGLILFDLLMKKQDIVWGFGKYEKDGIPIRGITYFVLANPPRRK